MIVHDSILPFREAVTLRRGSLSAVTGSLRCLRNVPVGFIVNQTPVLYIG